PSFHARCNSATKAGPPGLRMGTSRRTRPLTVASLAMDDAVAIIRTTALTKVYAGPNGQQATRPAVDQLDLEVRHGEIFGLLGPNGAGKTTTIGMLTTRVVPSSGEAWVGGIDVIAEPARAKQLIGVVTQTNPLDRSLTVYENLYFHGRSVGMTAKNVQAESTAV